MSIWICIASFGFHFHNTNFLQNWKGIYLYIYIYIFVIDDNKQTQLFKTNSNLKSNKTLSAKLEFLVLQYCKLISSINLFVVCTYRLSKKLNFILSIFNFKTKLKMWIETNNEFVARSKSFIKFCRTTTSLTYLQCTFRDDKMRQKKKWNTFVQLNLVLS